MGGLLYVAVVGRDLRPLFQAPFGAGGEDCGALVHASLDVVEEKLAERAAAPAPAAAAPNSGHAAAAPPSGVTPVSVTDCYLGLLHASASARAAVVNVFGWRTNTGATLLAAVDGALALRESEVRLFFNQLHALYADAVSSPFYAPGAAIESASFASGVATLQRML